MTDKNQSAAQRAAQHFVAPGALLKITSCGRGLIHSTFKVHARPPAQSPFIFILQRLNQYVFPCPDTVIKNVRTVTAHLAERGSSVPGLRFPQLMAGADGSPLYRDAEGGAWRALTFVEHSHSQDALANLGQARDIGLVLGHFHRLLADLDSQVLSDTLPGFHVAPGYLSHLDAAWDRWMGTTSDALQFCKAFVESRRGVVPVLEDAKAAGVLPLRVMHGDPKINNFLFDTRSERVISLIDLDTVKPGLIHYDLGDCLRSACNHAGEDPAEHQRVQFDLPTARAILEGYFCAAGTFLSPPEYAYIPMAIRLIPLELGMRFLADYLTGNHYFRVQDPQHNLRRAQAQFQLVASIESQAAALEDLVRAHSGSKA